MWKNNLKVAFRNLRKNRWSSLINIGGLVIGMTLSLFMLMFVLNETSYEDFQQQRHRIFRLALEWGKGGSQMKFAGVMPALAPALMSEVPEVEKVIRVQLVSEAEIRTAPDKATIVATELLFADPFFFEIFSYPWRDGEASTALTAPYCAVLSEACARSLFNRADVVGQTLFYESQPYQVTGVMGDSPANTHLRPEVILSYSTFQAQGVYPATPWQQWGADRTYILLRPGTNLTGFQVKLTQLVERNLGPTMAQKLTFHVQPLTKLHWIADFRGDWHPRGNILYLYIFLSTAILVLIIACFNFINLMTSQFLTRAREVGIRQVIGANRSTLIVQFLIENALLNLLALSISALLLELIFAPAMNFLQAPVVLSATHRIYTGWLFLLIFGVVLVAGLLPILAATRQQAAKLLRPTIWQGNSRFPLRKALLGFQFVISMVLLISVCMIQRQLHFMIHSDLGFQKENVALVRLPFDQARIASIYPVVYQELMKNLKIQGVSTAFTVPGVNSMSNMTVTPSGGNFETALTMQALAGDYDFVNVLGLKLIAGRDFSREFATDATAGLILNETAVRLLNMSNPIGNRVNIPGPNNQTREMTIIGVVRDFHIQSLHHAINPMILFIAPQQALALVIRIQPEAPEATLQFIQRELARLLPDAPIQVDRLAQVYANYYRAEQKMLELLTISAGLAIIIACGGLFGLTWFMLNRRLKELGIRKVLGATLRQLLQTLSREYLHWILWANLLAWPIGYYLVQHWLEHFAYRTSVALWIFPGAGVLTAGIALITIFLLTWRVVRINPVEVLRQE